MTWKHALAVGALLTAAAVSIPLTTVRPTLAQTGPDIDAIRRDQRRADEIRAKDREEARAREQARDRAEAATRPSVEQVKRLEAEVAARPTVSEVDALRAEVAHLKAALANAHSEAAKARDKAAADVVTAIGAMQARAAGRQAEVDLLNAKIQALREENDRLRATIEQVRKKPE